jgi:hypothetical protein
MKGFTVTEKLGRFSIVILRYVILDPYFRETMSLRPQSEGSTIYEKSSRRNSVQEDEIVAERYSHATLCGDSSFIANQEESEFDLSG